MVSGCSGVQTSHEKTQIYVEGDRNLVFRWSPLDVSTGGGGPQGNKFEQVSSDDVSYREGPQV